MRRLVHHPLLRPLHHPWLRPLRDPWRTSRLQYALSRRGARREVAEWKREGRPVPPPPAVKQMVIARYAAEFGLRALVETGTFMGATVTGQLRRFERIVSIELDPALAARARKRFARFRHVTILEGDSADLLPRVLAELDRPAVVWLDAHYSGGITARGPKDTPICEELAAVLAAEAVRVVLIDDARLFDGTDDYPTLDELRLFVERRADRRFEVADDVIRLTPSGGDAGAG